MVDTSGTYPPLTRIVVEGGVDNKTQSVNNQIAIPLEKIEAGRLTNRLHNNVWPLKKDHARNLSDLSKYSTGWISARAPHNDQAKVQDASGQFRITGIMGRYYPYGSAKMDEQCFTPVSITVRNARGEIEDVALSESAWDKYGMHVIKTNKGGVLVLDEAYDGNMSNRELMGSLASDTLRQRRDLELVPLKAAAEKSPEAKLAEGISLSGAGVSSNFAEASQGDNHTPAAATRAQSLSSTPRR